MVLEEFARAVSEVIHNSQSVKDVCLSTIGEEMKPTTSYSMVFGEIEAPWFHIRAPSEMSEGEDRIITLEIGIAIRRDNEDGIPKTTEYNGIKTDQSYLWLSQIVSVVLKEVRDAIADGLVYNTSSANGLKILESGIRVGEDEDGIDIYATIPIVIRQKKCNIGGS